MLTTNHYLSLLSNHIIKAFIFFASLVGMLSFQQVNAENTNAQTEAKTEATEHIWFITGANKGLGAAIAKAALDEGDKVVATARNVESTRSTLGSSDRLLVVPLDVTKLDQIQQAMKAAVEKFGRIDVLFNNAGYGQYGFFEEITEQSISQQFDVNLFGAMDVTRAGLPIMRQQRTGYIITISSVAGVIGRAGCTVYCSSKFAVEGWMESLNAEVKPFGLHAMLIEPSAFRTDFLDSNSVRYDDKTQIADYQKLTRDKTSYKNLNHKQLGDPKKLANAIITLINSDNSPLRFVAGKDAVERIEKGLFQTRQQESKFWKNLSTSLDFDN